MNCFCKNRYISLIILFLIVFSSCLWALNPLKKITQYTRQSWQIEDGLPQNTVSAIVQSREGYLWLATEEGLVRFDGVSFKVFDRYNTPEIMSSYITALCLGRNGDIWIGTLEGGLIQFNKKRFNNINIGPQLMDRRITSIAEDQSGRVWATTDGNGVLCLDQGKVVQFTTAHGLTSNQLNIVYCDIKGDLWFGTSSGLNVYQNGRFQSAVGTEKLQGHAITALTESKDGFIWIGTEDNGLARFHDGILRFYNSSSSLSIGFITVLLEDKEGSLWIGISNGGLIRLRDNQFESIGPIDGLTSHSIVSIYEDRQGILWLGTQTGGLSCLIDKLIISYSRTNGLPEDNVRSVLEDREGNLWMGTSRSGFACFEKGVISPSALVKGFPDRYVRVISEDHLGNVWLGIDSIGAVCFKQGKTISTKIAENLLKKRVRAIAEDNQGAIWFGTDGGGLSRLSGQRLDTFTFKDGLGSNFIRNLFIDSKGSLWIATSGGGISQFRDGKFRTYTTKDGLSSNLVVAIYEDSEGTLWFGTNIGGLIRLKNDRFSTVTKKDGLFSDTIYQILEDSADNFWMSCNRGIFSVKRRELNDFADGKIVRVHSVSFGKSDGMKSAECSGGGTPAGCKTKAGKLFFPTIRGISVVNPSFGQPVRPPPDPLIEEVRVDGKLMDDHSLRQITTGAERFEFHFTAFNFMEPEKIHFRYRLKGFDRDWVEAETRRVAYYTNLPPGEFEFQVTACNADGKWNPQEAGISFYLSPYFYQTPLFYAGVVLLILVASYALIILRTGQIKKKEIKLGQLVEERTQELKKFNEELTRINEELSHAYKFKNDLVNIAAHDLKTPLQTILGYSDIIIHQTNAVMDLVSLTKIGKIHAAAERMFRIIDNLLKTAALEITQMELRITEVDLGRLARSVIGNFQELTELKKQQIIFTADSNCVIHGDEDRLSDIMDNLIMNAIKYTPKRKSIKVVVKDLGESVQFAVKDEGPGLTEEDKKRVFLKFQRLSAQPTGGETSTGLGLSIVKQFVELHGGKAWVESSFGGGSTFFTDFPKDFIPVDSTESHD